MMSLGAAAPSSFHRQFYPGPCTVFARGSSLFACVTAPHVSPVRITLKGLPDKGLVRSSASLSTQGRCGHSLSQPDSDLPNLDNLTHKFLCRPRKWGGVFKWFAVQRSGPEASSSVANAPLKSSGVFPLSPKATRHSCRAH